MDQSQSVGLDEQPPSPVALCSSIPVGDISSVEYLRQDSTKDREKGDGSDSGIEFGSGGVQSLERLPNEALQLAPTPMADLQAVRSTTNSKDNESQRIPPNGELHREVYATEGLYSCDSSVRSFCSDENLLGDGKAHNTGGRSVVRDCASEGGGSESSSVYNQPVMPSSAKKRANGVLGRDDKLLANCMSASTTQLSKPDTLARAKFRASSVNRVGPPALLTKERARSKERGQSGGGSPLVRANSLRRPIKPDSLPVVSPMAAPSKRMSTLGRTQSVRTPGTTPSDSGRWPYGPGSGSALGTPRSVPRTGFNDSVVVVKTRLGQLSLDHGGAQSTFDKYATMPRRRRDRSTDQKASHESSTRSSSISRDRLTTTTKLSISTNSQKSTPVAREPVTPKMRSVVRRLTQKVSIFHEKSIQTLLTHQDLDNAFEGKVTVIDASQRDKASVSTQSEIRDNEMEELRTQVKHLQDEGERMRSALGGKSILLASVEQQLVKERESKVKLQKELQCNSERVVAILESHTTDTGDIMGESTDSLMMLETKVTTDSQVVAKQKLELKKMRNVCMALRLELDEALERERAVIAERESEEMQEFLQIEKSVLTDAAKTEEKAKWQIVVEKKDQEIKWLLEECRHLVRFCEQRRQENMGMQAKYGALEMKSKELLAQQGNAVSGASVALNTLGARLEQLVEQLIASYNISEQELEDMIFHNEAFAESSDSSNGSPGDVPTRTHPLNGQDLSPQRSHSFINVVINAIRNATTTLVKDPAAAEVDQPNKKQLPKQVERIQEEETTFGSRMEDSDGSTDMLDSETEPRLMMENVLVESSRVHSEKCEGSLPEADGGEDDSLNNLSQAISNRQQIELQTSQMLNFSYKRSLKVLKQQSSLEEEDASHASSLAEDMPSLICDNCTSTQEIVEKVISVDNLITKLLKVLRIVQQDNDNCIQHLVREKNNLQQNKTETEDKIKDFEDVKVNLKCQLTTMAQKLLDTEQELQNCRHEIDNLNHHICELSTLCSNKENNNECLDNNGQTRAIEDVLKTIMVNIDNGDRKNIDSVEGELYSKIMGLLKSNRELRAELTEQKRNPNWQLNAVSDLKRLYEVIDSALEVLNSTPAVIEQYPALSQLQKDLEETNFTLATTLPSYMAIMVSQQCDQNANPATLSLVSDEKTKKPSAAAASPAIDSVA